MVGAPKDLVPTLSYYSGQEEVLSKVGGSLSLCQVELRSADSTADCVRRQTLIDEDDTSSGDIFEDQLLGISVTASQGRNKGESEVIDVPSPVVNSSDFEG